MKSPVFATVAASWSVLGNPTNEDNTMLQLLHQVPTHAAQVTTDFFCAASCGDPADGCHALSPSTVADVSNEPNLAAAMAQGCLDLCSPNAGSDGICEKKLSLGNHDRVKHLCETSARSNNMFARLTVDYCKDKCNVINGQCGLDGSGSKGDRVCETFCKVDGTGLACGRDRKAIGSACPALLEVAKPPPAALVQQVPTHAAQVTTDFFCAASCGDPADGCHALSPSTVAAVLNEPNLATAMAQGCLDLCSPNAGSGGLCEKKLSLGNHDRVKHLCETSARGNNMFARLTVDYCKDNCKVVNGQCGLDGSGSKGDRVCETFCKVDGTGLACGRDRKAIGSACP